MEGDSFMLMNADDHIYHRKRKGKEAGKHIGGWGRDR